MTIRSREDRRGRRPQTKPLPGATHGLPSLSAHRGQRERLQGRKAAQVRQWLAAPRRLRVCRVQAGAPLPPGEAFAVLLACALDRALGELQRLSRGAGRSSSARPWASASHDPWLRPQAPSANLLDPPNHLMSGAQWSAQLEAPQTWALGGRDRGGHSGVRQDRASGVVGGITDTSDEAQRHKQRKPGWMTPKASRLGACPALPVGRDGAAAPETPTSIKSQTQTEPYREGAKGRISASRGLGSSRTKKVPLPLPVLPSFFIFNNFQH